MALHRCPYCKEVFTPSRYHPEQVVCSDPACQCRRRADYHREKRRTDPSYREQCTDSQEKWRTEHSEYMREYRKSHSRPPRKSHAPEQSRRDLSRLLDCVKNNLALDLTSSPASIWLITADNRVKNIVATAKLIIIEGLP